MILIYKCLTFFDHFYLSTEHNNRLEKHHILIWSSKPNFIIDTFIEDLIYKNNLMLYIIRK